MDADGTDCYDGVATDFTDFADCKWACRYIQSIPLAPFSKGEYDPARHSERSEGISCDADHADFYDGVATDFTDDADCKWACRCIQSMPLSPSPRGNMILLVIPSRAKESHATQITQIVMMASPQISQINMDLNLMPVTGQPWYLYRQNIPLSKSDRGKRIKYK